VPSGQEPLKMSDLPVSVEFIDDKSRKVMAQRSLIDTWLVLPPEEQRKELEATVMILDAMGVPLPCQVWSYESTEPIVTILPDWTVQPA